MTTFAYPNQRYTSNLGLSLFGMDEVLADNMNLIDAAYGAGSSINVNGTLVPSPNLSNTTPAAPSGYSNILWQYDSNGNISAYVTSGGGGDVTSVFGRTGAVTAQSGDYTLDQIGSPVSAPSFSMAAYALTFNYTSVSSLALINTTAATSSVDQGSPRLVLQGNYWNSGASSSETDNVYFAIEYGTFNANHSVIRVQHNTGQSICDGFMLGNALPLLLVGSTSGSVSLTAGTTAAALVVSTPVNATTGYQIGGAATSGNYLRGNGTNFVSSAIQVGDLPASVLTTSSSIANANLANSSITIDGDGTVFSNTAPGTISLGGSGSLSLNSQTQNTFLAAPNGSSGTPSFRAIGVSDLPTSGTWAFAGTLSGNFTTTGNILNTGTDTFGLSSYTAGISNSPSVVIAGSYESASAPTYAEDSWTLQDIVGTGVNGTSTLQLTHGGSTGVAAFALTNTTAATSSTTNASPFLSFQANYWTGAASAMDQWLIGSSLTAGGAASSYLIFTHTGASGASTPSIIFGLPSYTAGVTNSPLLVLAGSYENAATPTYVQDYWSIQNVIGSGVNGASALTFSHTGTAGGAYVLFPAGTSGSAPSSGGGIGLGSGSYGWSQSGGVIYEYLGTGGGHFYYVNGAACYYEQFANASINLQSRSTSFPAICISGNMTTQTASPCIALNNGAVNGTSGMTFAATSGTQIAVSVGPNANYGTVKFAPASGTANFVAFDVSPTIDQTSTASGNYTAIRANVTETAFLGTTALLLDLQVGGTSKFSVDHAGNLYVTGTEGVTQNAEAVGTLATKGGIVTTFTAVSDERLKNHELYEGGLEEILGINPVRYRWNEAGQKLSGQSGDKDYIGFIAQNVQKHIPEAVWQSQRHEYLCFEDRPVIAALVNAVKILTARIEELERRTR